MEVEWVEGEKLELEEVGEWFAWCSRLSEELAVVEGWRAVEGLVVGGRESSAFEIGHDEGGGSAPDEAAARWSPLGRGETGAVDWEVSELGPELRTCCGYSEFSGEV